MNLGIDIDDTIANTYDVLLKYLQEYTRDDIVIDREKANRDILAQMYHTNFRNGGDKQDKEFLNRYYEKTVLKVETKIDAVESIKKLKEEGNQIFLITARFPSNKFNIEELTKDWLKKYGIQYDKLILNSQNKVITAKEHCIDIFVDDNIKNCTDMAKAGIKTYIMDSNVNKDFKDENIERVYSWSQLYQKIEDYKKVRNKM